MELRAEVGVDAKSQVEETLDVAIVEWLDAKGMRTRLEAGDDKAAVSVQ